MKLSTVEVIAGFSVGVTDIKIEAELLVPWTRPFWALRVDSDRLRAHPGGLWPLKASHLN